MDGKVFSRGFLVLLAAVLILGSAASVFGENIVGDWQFKMSFREREITADVKFVKDADGALSGTWTSRRGENALSDVKYEEGKLSFVRTSTWQDQERKTTYTGTVEGDKITGTASGERGDFPFEAVRVLGPKAVIGTWDMKLKMQDREFEAVLVITKNADGSLAGKWESNYGQNTISDMKFENGKLTFKRKTKMNERQWKSTFDGTVTGNQLKGTIRSERGELTAEGTRRAAGIVGKWELTSESPRGTRTRILTVNEDMTGTYQMRDNDVPIKDLKVEGSDVSFKVEMSFRERSFEMEFKGRLEGNTLDGEFITERGARPVTGKRVVAEAAGAAAGEGG